ncbi:MAG: 5-amino-6-(D-ribitylamino)uracil--L-tyrosine 4-hydroxyphenyl transferase CofH, partial [Hyphomicrobiaceae bacterium]
MNSTPIEFPLPVAAAVADAALRDIASDWPLEKLMQTAAALRDEGHGSVVSYSRKVFIPLTRLCRDVCHYCTFAKPPRAGEPLYLSEDEVLGIARAGVAAGCREALFTLGEKPELRYRLARETLEKLGFASTTAYLAHVADLVFRETGFLPHVNPGTMTAVELARLRQVSISQGLMLESAAARLCEKGGPHFGSPDKHPSVRIETIRRAGAARIPFTSGILIGIGETRSERIDALLALRDLHARYGHIQEIIIQNFRAKPATRMAAAPEPGLDELKWTIAVARLAFGPAMNIQAPPNLTSERYGELIDAGINDWGGVSPVTPDHVNPEAAWPQIVRLEQVTAGKGKVLVERLATYPAYLGHRAVRHWHDHRFLSALSNATDATGLARTDPWAPGLAVPPALAAELLRKPSNKRRINGARVWAGDGLPALVAKAMSGRRLETGEIVRLFSARGGEVGHILASADELRQAMCGDTVSYVVTRNINYTNICGFRCRFCAFSKGRTAAALRGAPYDLGLDEIVRRSREAWQRGATEVCLQGGIHPDYTGATYLAVCRAIKAAVPGIHVHAFSPLEVAQGAGTLGISVPEFLSELKSAGLGSLPGTAAEILDDEVRADLCPDKLDTRRWLEVVEHAHDVGLTTTATIMFGHIDHPVHWARHLLAIRDLQERTGGFTEMVPLPFVHMEAPMYVKGEARRGPTFREAILMHALARLVLHPSIANIQVSWVKLGEIGAAVALNAGANDLGGTLMNESISRAAGTVHGEVMPPAVMERIIRDIGRAPRQRTTRYGDAPSDLVKASFYAAPIEPKQVPS